MIDWKKTLISPTVPIIDAMRIIQEGGTRMVMVVDADMRLVGIATDGDMRRAMLRGASLNAPVADIMNRTPMVVMVGDSPELIISKMIQEDRQQVPVLDESGRLVHVEFLHRLLRRERKFTQVVVMAGGLGVRMFPLTENCPKPMLRIGKKPILEVILDNMIQQGFFHFMFSVNYKAEMIENHFGNGCQWGVEIEYVRETKRLGTAGALGLLRNRPDAPFIVINGDVLTSVNFGHLVEYHNAHSAAGTMGVREYNFQVPYGVVRVEEGRLQGITEKPAFNYFINAGVYVLSPTALEFIPHDTYFDMTSLFSKLMASGMKTMAYSITDLWMDIGTKELLQQADSLMMTRDLEQ